MIFTSSTSGLADYNLITPIRPPGLIGVFSSDQCSLYANTDKGGLKQRLDEHLVRVAKQAVRVAHCLPHFSAGMERVADVSNLHRKSHKAFSWQDKAVTKIRDHRKDREKVNPFLGKKIKKYFFRFPLDKIAGSVV